MVGQDSMRIVKNVYKGFTKGKRPKKLKVEFCLSEPSGGTIIKIPLAIRDFLSIFDSG